jgi:hypothetical protein
MKRRTFIAGLGSAAAWPVVARAQQRRVRLPVVGVLWPNSPPFPLTEFREGLAEKGLRHRRDRSDRF